MLKSKLMACGGVMMILVGDNLDNAFFSTAWVAWLALVIVNGLLQRMIFAN